MKILERWQNLLKDLKRLKMMQDTLKIMKGELNKCYKP